ncbi:MAG: V-type ATP synthase subunit F [Chloroflexi bacterium]|nr:V-type ATP synthase subunit F [Chloroflexota bacterium]
MSQLFVLTRPALVPGFQLAGVDAHGAEDVETAQELIAKWLDAGEVGLLAIDDGLLEHMDVNFLNRLSSSEHLLYLPIPGGKPLGPEASQRHRITALIRKAIGFHITFKGEEEGGKT